MKIWVLAENTAKDKRWEAEHGLSLYIEACGHKILFDTGQSELFLRNAKRLDVYKRQRETGVLIWGSNPFRITKKVVGEHQNNSDTF